MLSCLAKPHNGDTFLPCRGGLLLGNKGIFSFKLSPLAVNIVSRPESPASARLISYHLRNMHKINNHADFATLARGNP